MNWFKMYAEFATDAKVQSMSEAMQRRFIMLLCLQCTGDLGKLNDEELCTTMRISPLELEKTRELFHRKGFIGDTWVPRNWSKRQEPSDPTAAERMRRLRERYREHDRNVARNVTPLLRVEGEVEGDTEGESPLPPVISLDPISKKCIDVAAQRWGACNGDSVIGDLLREFDPSWVHAAMDKEWDKHGAKLNPPYLRAILQGFQREGGPPKPKHENNGKTAVQQRPEETAIPLKPRWIPPVGDPDRPAFLRMWNMTEENAS